MNLYPITILDAATAGSANNLMPSGTMLVIPIDMNDIQMTQISMAQLSLTQDYSLRTWVSLYPASIPIDGLYPILRAASVPFIIYVAGQTPPANTKPILVTPGRYFLNILNLTNEQNVLAFSMVDLALSATLTGISSSGLVSPVVPTRVPTTFAGVSSTTSAGRVLTSVSAAPTGVSATSYVGTVRTSSTLVVAGDAGNGHAGTVLTSVSPPFIGCTGTGHAGILSVMTMGLRLTPRQWRRQSKQRV